MSDNIWSHIEYGAANYGKSKESDDQLKTLYETLDMLVAQLGKEGIFYVNDLDIDMTLYAREQLGRYCIAKGYNGIIIASYPGDYTSIEPPRTDSAHLKNPPPHMLSLEFLRSNSFVTILAQHSVHGLEIHTYAHAFTDTLFCLGIGFYMLGKAPSYISPGGVQQLRNHVDRYIIFNNIGSTAYSPIFAHNEDHALVHQ